MSEGSKKTGFVTSAALHAALLGVVIFGFAFAPRFDDAPESIPVATVTTSEFNEIMHGEKQAPPALKPAEPPAPPLPPPDLRKSEEPPPPPPPPRPSPPPPPPPSPPPPREPPAPPPKPEALETPAPPSRPKVVETPPERPRETPTSKPKPEALSSLIAKEKSDEPKPSPRSNYDPRAIARLISQTKPGEAQASPASNLGAPEQHAQRMSPSVAAALDSWFKDAYMNCWSPPPTTPEGETYIAEVQVEFNSDGSLAGQPVLVNPPSDPAWKPHAESAWRAAMKCNPMRVPPQFAPYFQQWRSKTIYFDPRDASG